MNENEKKNDLASVGEEVFAKRGDPISPVREEPPEGWHRVASPHSAPPMSEGTPNRLPQNPRERAETGKRAPAPRGAVRAGGRGLPQRAKKPQAMQKKGIGGFFERLIGFFKGAENSHREHKHFEIGRRFAMIGFGALSLVAVIACTVLGYSYSGDSIKLLSQMTESSRSATKAYSIVYSEADAWGADAAAALRDLFLTKTGASLKIVSDAESVGRHEIRVGYTNRMTDDYLTSVTALGSDGYAILIGAGDNVNILAFSEVGADAAIKYFVNSYVGSYIGGELRFSNRMNLSVVSRTGEEPNIELRESELPLNFTEAGKFKVIVFSDSDINPYTVSAIEKICEKEKPQLAVFAGDVSSGLSTKAQLEEYVATLVAPLEKAKIPWTVIFGEQDYEGGLSARAQLEVYSAFEYCVAAEQMTANDTFSYFLPVFEAGKGGDDGSAPIFGIWAMGQIPMISKGPSAIASDPLLNAKGEEGADYGYVSPEHIAWFTENSKVLGREGGGSLPTVMITHTPVYEFSIVADNPESTRLYGSVGEKVSYSPINTGLFAAAAESGSVLGLYSGHDHLNSFAGRYCGIELGYVSSVGYDGYGFGGTFDINNSLRGGRIIELSLKDGSVLCSSRMAYAADYGISAD